MATASRYIYTLPVSQRTEALAAQAAANWKMNPANAMTLPENLNLADDDNDGLIDRAEFEKLIKATGAHGLTFEMVDKDGSGYVTMEEIQKMQDINRGRIKARGNA